MPSSQSRVSQKPVIERVVPLMTRMESIEHRLDIVEAHLAACCLDDCPCWNNQRGPVQDGKGNVIAP